MQIRLSTLSSVLLVLSAILVPMYFTNFRLPLGGLILRLADIMALLTIGLFFVCYRYKVSVVYFPIGFKLLCIFLIYSFINSLWQSGFFYAFTETVQWFVIISSLVIVYSQAVASPEKFSLITLKAALLVCVCVVAYHFSIGKFMHYKSLGDAKYIFALTGVLLLTHIYYYQDKRFLLALYCLYPFILLSLERKGILSFHLALVVYIAAQYRFVFKVLLLIFCIIGTFLLITLIADYDFSQFSFFEYNNYEMISLDEDKAKWASNYHRQSLLENGWDIFIHNPFFGVGAKMLPYYMMDYYINSGLAIYTHNVLLDTLIEQGVIGLILLLLPYFSFVASGILNSFKHVVVFTALCLYAVVMLFFMSGGAPSIVLFYLPIFGGFIVSSDINRAIHG